MYLGMDRTCGGNQMDLKRPLKFTEHHVGCEDCQDTGYVSIWHPDTIRAALEAERRYEDPEKIIWRRCVVLCICPSAEGKATHFTRSGRKIPALGDNHWHIKAHTETARADACTYSPESRYEWSPYS